MKTQYRCKKEGRKTGVRFSTGADGSPLLNGIDYLEVSSIDQKELTVHFIHNLPGQEKPVPSSGMILTKNNIIINGGVRIKDVHVESISSSNNILTLIVNTPGDFSMYTLRLVASPTESKPPEGFDPELSEIDFSFKINCPNEFDCKSSTICPPESILEPNIDYLAKDYVGFRRLMLDRLSVIMPDWKEKNPADLGIVLVELLAYAADQLSYYQDAVATEAYLGTARKRISVRRHVRLLDYPMHDGCNSRVWITLGVSDEADGLMLPGPSEKEKRAGTRLLTRIDMPPGTFHHDDFDKALGAGALVFETMHNITLREAHNEMHFHTWGDERCCLPKGTTQATLKNIGDKLKNLTIGDVLIFEEVRGQSSGRVEDADPAHRHAVRLTNVKFTEDLLFSENPDVPGGPQRMRVVKIQWAAEDSLPFPLCLHKVEDSKHPGIKQPVSVVRGNVVLADHGYTIIGEELNKAPPRGNYRPKLSFGPVTQQGWVLGQYKNQSVLFDPESSASTSLSQKINTTIPAVRLHENGELWTARRDLLSSDRFAREFIVEMEDDGLAYLRFGDDVLGRRPSVASPLKATYRIGNGSAGNVGAEAIAHVITTQRGITSVRNPMPARGGIDPELIEQVRLYAPQAFRIQERAVTEADYAMAAQRYPGVQKAMATLCWTGSWYTIFIMVDRKGGKPVNMDFKKRLCTFLERFRLAGYDLEIDGPLFVPLDIILTVCVNPGYFCNDVKRVLLETFSNRNLPDGRNGFFHPDNFTFGQSVFLSQIVAAAMKVPGVTWVKPTRFQRWGHDSHRELDEGSIIFGRLEIARLDNDPNYPENGKIEFEMEGGL